MCNRIHDSLKITNWFKLDLNNDGLTDLFFTDFNLEQLKLCVFNFGGNNYKVEAFPINLITECVFVKPVKVQNLNLLEIYYQVENTKKIEKRLITYKFNKFVEYNPNPSRKSISYICFDMLGIKDKSNAFSLRVDRQGIIELKHYDSEEKLVVRKDTSRDLELGNMFELADYTDFLSIDYDYSNISEEYYGGKLVFGHGVNSVKEIKFYKGIFEHFIIRDIIGYFFRKKFEIAN